MSGLKEWMKKNSVYMYDSKGHIYNGEGYDVSEDHQDNDGDIHLISPKHLGEYRWKAIKTWLSYATFWKQGYRTYKEVDKTLEDTLALTGVSIMWQEVKAFLGEKEVKKRVRELAKE